MLFRLIRIVEDHADQICGHVIRQTADKDYLAQLRCLPEPALRAILKKPLVHFGNHFCSIAAEELRDAYVDFGSRCFEQSIPLHEVVRMVHILKQKLTEKARDSMIVQTAVDVYAQEESEHHIGCLFEALVYHLVCGYEQGLLDAAGLMPSICHLPLPPAS
jgi:hypothetical protein